MSNIIIEYRDTSFIKAKFEYKKFERLLERISPELKYYIENLYKEIPYKEMIRIDTPKILLTDDNLIEIARNFISDLNDEEMMEAFNYIVDNELIEFREKNDYLSKYVSGLTISNINKIIVYRSYTVDDIRILIHELGHAITNILMLEYENPIFKIFMSEYVAYYFELLFIRTTFKDFLKKDSIMCDILECNRLVNFCANIFEIKLQNLALTGFDYKFNPNKINKKFKNEENSFNITIDDKSAILNENIYRRHGKAHSYLLALETVEQSLYDLEIGIFNFRKMLTESIDHISSIEELYSKYNITYPENNNYLKRELTKHDILKSRINEE